MLEFDPESAQTGPISDGSLTGGWRVDKSPHPGGDEWGAVQRGRDFRPEKPSSTPCQ